ncbi:translation initiation factor 2 [Streptomyces sp. S1]|uniref:translation initiation factor 2 n=1 Tax=Streptomyces sp. S1 TaxID=718288 RepID=UPI003D729D74
MNHLRAAGGGRRAAGGGQRAVLVAVRSAGALHRLLDVLPVFDGDERVAVRFTLVPGSEFAVEALAALDRSGVRVLAWEEALDRPHDLVLTASPKGAPQALSGPRVLLPHGAGFNKTVEGDGSPHLPSGLDPYYLLAGGEPWASLHALAHGEQVDRLTESCPPAAARAAVVGDPTLDRLLDSRARREEYRAALGTGARRLVVLTSTWGPESLLRRRPGLPGELLGLLPHDAYQLALVLHPNEYSRIGSFDLSRRLGPALRAGLVLAGPYEEWAAVLVAADAVITDHGSTALYAAALGRAVVGAYDGGHELIPGSPMARLLARAPGLSAAADAQDALRAAGEHDLTDLAHTAFARQGLALPLLRTELYRLMGLEPRTASVAPRPLPPPVTVPRGPAAFAVRADVSGHRVEVARFPSTTTGPVHHLAAEYPAADRRRLQSASVLWRHARPSSPAPHSAAWTAAGWTASVLDEFPGPRTAAALLTPDRVLLRHHAAGPLSARIEPCHASGRVLRADPAAVISAVHAWLAVNTAPAQGDPPVSLVCDTGVLRVRVHLAPADEADLVYEL